MNVKEIIIDNVRVVLIYGKDTTIYRTVNARFYIDNNLKNWKLHSTFNDSVSKKTYSQHKGFKILEKIPIENIQEYFKL